MSGCQVLEDNNGLEDTQQHHGEIETNLNTTESKLHEIQAMLGNHDPDKKIATQIEQHLTSDCVTLLQLSNFDKKNLELTINSWELNTFDVNPSIIRGLLFNGLRDYSQDKTSTSHDHKSMPNVDKSGNTTKKDAVSPKNSHVVVTSVSSDNSNCVVVTEAEMKMMQKLDNYQSLILDKIETVKNESKMQEELNNDLLIKDSNDIIQVFDELIDKLNQRKKYLLSNLKNISNNNNKNIENTANNSLTKLKAINYGIGDVKQRYNLSLNGSIDSNSNSSNTNNRSKKNCEMIESMLNTNKDNSLINTIEMPSQKNHTKCNVTFNKSIVSKIASMIDNLGKIELESLSIDSRIRKVKIINNNSNSRPMHRYSDVDFKTQAYSNNNKPVHVYAADDELNQIMMNLEDTQHVSEMHWNLDNNNKHKSLTFHKSKSRPTSPRGYSIAQIQQRARGNDDVNYGNHNYKLVRSATMYNYDYNRNLSYGASSSSRSVNKCNSDDDDIDDVLSRSLCRSPPRGASPRPPLPANAPPAVPDTIAKLELSNLQTTVINKLTILDSHCIYKFECLVIDNGGILTTQEWDINTNKGGFLQLECKSLIIKSGGIITVRGKGYKGGQSAGLQGYCCKLNLDKNNDKYNNNNNNRYNYKNSKKSSNNNRHNKNNTKSDTLTLVPVLPAIPAISPSIQSNVPNYGGGGGGQISQSVSRTAERNNEEYEYRFEYGCGGGGGYGTNGYNGAKGNKKLDGKGGCTYGNNKMNKIYLGSGGGSGYYSNGTNGGGAIIIKCKNKLLIANNGKIIANGENASGRGVGVNVNINIDINEDGCDSGCGSGGSIYIRCMDIVHRGEICAIGGRNIKGIELYGAGGDGRIRIDCSEKSKKSIERNCKRNGAVIMPRVGYWNHAAPTDTISGVFLW